MKILLVETAVKRDGLSWTAYTDAQGRYAMSSSGLVSLASLVDADDEVRIVDEKVSGPLWPEDIDEELIGISTKTMDAKRAYLLADALRARGKTVVIGGIHATLMPGEVQAHADAVSVGEGEHTWPLILRDYKRGELKSIYRAKPGVAKLMSMPKQRHELLDHSKFAMHSLQSARGCTFDCEFCPTRVLTGSGVRQRSLDQVAREVEHLIELQDKPVMFTENIFGAGDVNFIRELSGRLRGVCKNYAVLVDYQAMVPEVGEALAASGCKVLLINVTGKIVEEEVAALERARAAGLKIWGYYMFGFEDDTPDVFQRAIDRTREFDMVCASLSILTPFPGTDMGERLWREGRVFCRDTTLMDHNHVLFRPKNMSVEQLEQGFDYVKKELADWLGIQGVLETICGEHCASCHKRKRQFHCGVDALLLY